MGNALLYGAETRPMSWMNIRKLTYFWYGCLKSIKGLRWHTKRAHRFKEFGQPDVKDLIAQRTCGYIGIVARMNPNRLPFKALFGRVPGRVAKLVRRRIY